MSNNFDGVLSIYFYHGGNIVSLGHEKMYVGGVMTGKHGLDADRFGYFDLEHEVEQLGYKSWEQLYFKISKSSEFEVVFDDKGVKSMIDSMQKGAEYVSVYVDNGIIGKKDGWVDDDGGAGVKGCEGAEDDGGAEVHQDSERVGDEDDPRSWDSKVDQFLNGLDPDFLKELDENYIRNKVASGGVVPADLIDIPIDGGSEDERLSEDADTSDDEYIEARKNLMNQSKKKENILAECEIEELMKRTDPFELELEAGDEEYQEIDIDDDWLYYSDSSDEDGVLQRKEGKQITYDPNCDHKSLVFETGMRFKDGFQCKYALQTNGILNGYELKFVRNSETQCEAICIPGCRWRIYGSYDKADGHLLIKTVSRRPHTCYRVIANKLATSEWIATQLMDTFRSNPNITPKEVEMNVMSKYACQVSYYKCFRARQAAREKINGTLKEHYGKLRNYVAELVKKDREGRFQLLVEHNIFKAFYVGFSALKKGFIEGCRPIIGLDGCFLKIKLKGVLLCAIAKDGNNQMYPIACAVVEVENQICWTWFLKILLEELDITDGNGFTFVSDQQKGLMNALAELAPHAEHRNCARHVYSNWKKQHKGVTLKNMFWRASTSTFVEAFKKEMEDMKAENIEAHDDFMERDPTKFCKAFISENPKNDMVDNNISETFNGFILKSREKPLIDMLQSIRCQLMKRQFMKVQQIKEVSDSLCPRIRKKLEDLKYDCRLCNVIPNVGGRFEVLLKDDGFVVDDNKRSCTCRVWDLTGIPYIHACAVINYINHKNYMSALFGRKISPVL